MSNDPAAASEDVTEKACDFLMGVLDRMGIAADIDVKEEDDKIVLEIQTANPDVVIGRKGQVVDALQHLVGKVVFRERSGEKGKPFVVDAGGYRTDVGYEDWDFNIRLGLSGARPVCVEQALFHYRVAAGGMLMSVAHQRHGMLWRTIQEKHPGHYSLTGFLGHMRTWGGRPKNHATWKLIAFWAAHRVLPDRWFAALFRRVIRGSHLRRAAAGR